MPLIKSKSPAAFRTNVAEMIRAGHPRDQALAAAYRIKRGKAEGGAVDKLPEHYADIGMSRIEDRRYNDESLRKAGIDLLKSRSKMRHAKGMMDSQRTEAEVIDRLVPRGYAAGGRAMALAKRIQRRRYQDGGEVALLGDTPRFYDDPFEAAAQRTRQSVKPGFGRAEGPIEGFVRDMMIPTTPLDAGMMVAGGPFGKLAKIGALGLGAALTPSDAEAGALGRIVKGIRAYHGSPHDFPAMAEIVFRDGRPNQIVPLEQKLAPDLVDAIQKGYVTLKEHPLGRFDLRKIGTGEGAQSYGHGLYFAENEGVARSYRDQLSNARLQSSPGYEPLWGSLSEMLVRKGHDPARVRSVLGELRGEHQAGGALAHVDPAKFPSEYQAIAKDALEMGGKTLDTARGIPTGRMYEVNINARPEQFLDWDKPFTAQSPQVQKSVANILEGEPIPQMSDAARGYDIYNQVVNRGVDTRPSIHRDDRLLWAEGPKNKRIASSMLNEAGIPGIKYLDQGSRNAGGWHITPPDQTTSGKWMVKSSDYNSKGLHFDTKAEAERALQEKIGSQTSNYVVFDDKLIDILRKYGLTGMLGGGAGAATLANQDQGMQAGGSVMNSPYAGIFGNSGVANTPPVERPDCPEPRRHWRDERPRDYGQQQSPLGGLPVDPITQALLQKYGAQLLPGLGFGQGQGMGPGMSPGMGQGQGQGMGLGGLDPLSGLSPKIQGFLPSLPGFAAGGAPDSPYSDMMPVNQPHAGYIPGSTGGRADKVPMGVRQKSYVIPADVVSGLGEGNSAAGAKKLSTIFSGAPYGAKAPKIKGRPLKSTKIIRQRFADGGMPDMEPPAEIAASHGEFVVGPEQVAQIGGGDIDHGHDVLDRFVEHVRKRTIKTLRKLPGPKSR